MGTTVEAIIHKSKSYIEKGITILSEDKITVYAAQASFFVIISVMPFLSLLISIISLFIPADVLSIFESYSLSEELLALVGSVVSELQSAPKVSLLSVSVLATLWSASKGIASIQTGLETVYHSVSGRKFPYRILKSLVSTLAFIALILLSVILMLFSDYIGRLLRFVKLTDVFLKWKTPFIFAFMCIVFTALYASAAKRSHSFKSTVLLHLPGAIFASLGWILFSNVYSFYIKHFPRASYIYGGLAAVCLMMLWFYFCMIILLLGAEVNKLILAHSAKT